MVIVGGGRRRWRIGRPRRSHAAWVPEGRPETCHPLRIAAIPAKTTRPGPQGYPNTAGGEWGAAGDVMDADGVPYLGKAVCKKM